MRQTPTESRKSSVGWPVYIAIAVGVVASAVLWWSWRNELARLKADFKSEEHVTEAMQEAKERAGTVTDKMAPAEVAEALDKLGRPGTP